MSYREFSYSSSVRRTVLLQRDGSLTRMTTLRPWSSPIRQYILRELSGSGTGWGWGGAGMGVIGVGGVTGVRSVGW